MTMASAPGGGYRQSGDAAMDEDKNLLFGSSDRAGVFVTNFPSAHPGRVKTSARGDVKLRRGSRLGVQNASEKQKAPEIGQTFPPWQEENHEK
jgi:hypothetical protein